MKPRLLALLILILGLAAGWIFINRVEIKQNIQDWQRKKDLPPTVVVPSIPKQDSQITNNNQEIEDIKKNSGITLLPPPMAGAVRNDLKELPAEINLAVPFVVQAPYAVWDKLHEESCEEAAMIMLDAFYQGKRKISQDEAELAIQKLVQWEKNTFGYFEDTTAEENARILKEYFGLAKARAIYDITVADIKKELALGWPVVVPAAGRLLKNPYFRGAGPVYHMMVIKGYTKDGRFITNEPGTKRGADFTYQFEDLYQAIHDWVPGGKIEEGRKVMIVLE